VAGKDIRIEMMKNKIYYYNFMLKGEVPSSNSKPDVIYFLFIYLFIYLFIDVVVINIR